MIYYLIINKSNNINIKKKFLPCMSECRERERERRSQRTTEGKREKGRLHSIHGKRRRWGGGRWGRFTNG